MEKTIYIAGPMRGYPEHNFPAFDKAEKELSLAGFKVHSPAKMCRDLDKPNEVLPQLVYAKRDLAAVFDSTHIAMLPGWEKSVGARAEHAVAVWIGLVIVYLH